jgi:AcrR family transcriptional regulator
MQEKSSRSNAERTQATRAALIDAARRLFVDQGYAQTGTPDIVAAAAVTRGALYHHFADKRELFLAVAQAMAQEVADAVVRGSEGAGSAAEALNLGTQAYLAAMAEQGRARLLLAEAPAVLSPPELDALNDQAGAAALLEGLQALFAERGPAPRADELSALARLLSAAFDRMALALARGEPAQPYEAAMQRLLRGLAA